MNVFDWLWVYVAVGFGSWVQVWLDVNSELGREGAHGDRVTAVVVAVVMAVPTVALWPVLWIYQAWRARRGAEEKAARMKRIRAEARSRADAAISRAEARADEETSEATSERPLGGPTVGSAGFAIEPPSGFAFIDREDGLRTILVDDSDPRAAYRGWFAKERHGNWYIVRESNATERKGLREVARALDAKPGSKTPEIDLAAVGSAADRKIASDPRAR